MKGDMRTVQMKGTPLTLEGTQVKAGDKAPDAQVINTDMTAHKLSESAGKLRLISVVTSLDTSLCSKQTVRFDKMVSEMGGDVEGYAVSADLPFAQARFAKENNIDSMKLVSDYKDMAFGENFGLKIQELRLLSRAVIVVDKDDTIKHMEIVDDIGTEPDYDKAMAALEEAKDK